MSDADLGYGSLFEIESIASPNEWTPLDEVFDITPPASDVDQVDVTHMQSPGRRREFIDGLIDGGECSFQMNYVPGSASDLILLDILATPVGEERTRNLRITYPNGVKDTFAGNLMTYQPSIPTGDKMVAEVTFRVTGAITRTPA